MASAVLDSNRVIGAIFGIAIVLGSAILGAVAKLSFRTINFEGETSGVVDAVLPGDGAIPGAMLGQVVLTAIVTARQVIPTFKSGKVELCDVERGAIIGAMAGFAVPWIMFGWDVRYSAFEFALSCLGVPPVSVLCCIMAGSLCLMPIDIAGAIVDGFERVEEARYGVGFASFLVGFLTTRWLIGDEYIWLVLASSFLSLYLGNLLFCALVRIRRAHGVTMAVLLVAALAVLVGGVGMVVRFTRQPPGNARPDRETTRSVADEDEWHPPMKDWEAKDFDPFKLLMLQDAQDSEDK